MMFGKKKMITIAAILLAAALTGCGSTGTESGIISELVTEAPTETPTEPTTEMVATTEEATEESTEAETEPETFAAVGEGTNVSEKVWRRTEQYTKEHIDNLRIECLLSNKKSVFLRILRENSY